MAQIQSPETYADGQQVTAARLNNQTNGAVLLPGAVTDQTAISGGVAAADAVIVHDASASAIRKATVTELLGGGVPVVASTVTGVAGSDLVLTPAAGQKVDVAGNLEADDINATDDVTVGGDLVVTGSSTLTGNVIADNGFTSNGVSNFTGTLQVGGTVGYVLTEVVEESMSYTGTPASGAWTAAFTSASYVKPSGEIWIIEADFRFRTEASVYLALRLQQTSPSSTLNGTYNIEGAGSNYFHVESGFFRSFVPDATTFTSTFTFDVQPSASGVTFTLGETSFPYAGFFTSVSLPVSKFRIYKYKTA
jgi:hypothetical protein